MKKYAAQLDIVQLKKDIEAMESRLNQIEEGISSMRLDMIQWKGQQLPRASRSSRRNADFKKAIDYNGGRRTSLLNSTTVTIKAAWAACA